MTSSENTLGAVPGALTFPPAAPPSQVLADPYAPTAWGSYDHELTMPSGQKCRVKKLDFEDVFAAGMMDRLNTLQGVVDKHTKKAEGQPPLDPTKMLADKRTARQMTSLMNEVVCMVVTAPKVVMPPEKMEERKAGVVYADTVGIVDKMEIFAFAMGDLSELESFRGGAKQPAERVADVESDVSPA